MKIDRELADEAAEAVRWVLKAKRPAVAWERAAEIVAALEAAVAADDEDGVDAALYDLELLSRRVQEQLGTESEDTDVEAPPRIRDRANELVHTLSPQEPEPK